ncbi:MULTISPECIES: type II toxin-antitoxin system prevent-host-death family antitoxin [Streptomyces]|uniref:type II toxin-antitoxin system prevent-host-death family antitoxin n=1 Tax=Streptomyces TaxID=1883 RepID=UPI0020766087|nr:type II toxin-antitoxin system prevent-host-death family antitoxin [Streptomyces sp. STCH 565 A]MCM8552297.1 type II toxin-antitoxin system Phd/YefM family antitoxin [Streptomyces sp. STCH 565 A]
MKKPQSLPVEQARKEFADLLDGSQHKGEHTEITRRSKRSGVLVPPDWYDTVTAEQVELRDLRRENAELRRENAELRHAMDDDS